MAALASAAEIPPGGEGAIKATVNTRGRSGVISKIITVETSDPNNRTARLRLKTTVMVEAAFSPKNINIGRVGRGEKVSKTATFVSRDPSRVKLTKVKATSESGELSAKIITIEGKQGIEISFKGTKIGSVRGFIEATTTSEKNPELKTIVRGIVLGNWEVIPRTISFSEPEEGSEPTKRTIKIKARKQTRYQITKAIDQEKAVTAQVSKSPDGDEFHIELTLNKVPEKRRGLIEISTNDPEEPTLETRYFVRRKHSGRQSPRALESLRPPISKRIN